MTPPPALEELPMVCDELARFDPCGGAVQRRALAAHLRGCDECRALHREERRLALLAREAGPRRAPLALWRRVETALDDARAQRRDRRRATLASLAAGVLIGVGAWFASAVRPSPSSLLEGAEARAFAAEERRLEAELAGLEERAASAPEEFARAPLRAQIQHVDANLAWCQDHVRQNALNRSVHRSLVEGYRLKAELLRELLSERRS